MITPIGTVVSRDSLYFTIECPDAPAHLRRLNLVAWLMRGAKIGDRVLPKYQVTPSNGLWNVVAILGGQG